MYQTEHNTDSTEKNDSFECHFCGQVFNSELDMRTHVLSHIKEEPLQSVDDDELSEFQPVLEPHILLTEGVKQEPLDEEFNTTDDGNFKCSTCGTEFRHRGHYASHLLRHNGQCKKKLIKKKCVKGKKYKCQRCNTEYRYPGNYYRHMQRHEEEDMGNLLEAGEAKEVPIKSPPLEILESEQAPLATVSPEIKQIETDVSPKERYACEVCKKTFALKSVLRRHTLIHTGEKPFKCKLCGMTCARRDNLKLHMDICEKRSKPYKCRICHEDCRSSGMLKQHMLIHVGEKDVDLECLPSNMNSMPGRKVEILTDDDKLDYTVNCSRTARLAERTKSEESQDFIEDESTTSFGDPPYKDSIVIWEDATKISVSVKHLVAQIKEQYVKCSLCSQKFINIRLLQLHKKSHFGVGSGDESNSLTLGNSENVSSSTKELPQFCTITHIASEKGEKSSELAKSIKWSPFHFEGNERWKSKMSSGENANLAITDSVSQQDSDDSCDTMSSTTPKPETLRKFICSICNHTFKHEGFYRRHMRWHATKLVNQKVSEVQNDGTKCDFSPEKTFDASDIKKEPEENRSEEKTESELPQMSTVCPECGRKFKRRNHMMLHMVKSHRPNYVVRKSHGTKYVVPKREKTLKCPGCIRTFKLPAHLASHLKRGHKNKIGDVDIADIKKEESLVSCADDPQDELPDFSQSELPEASQSGQCKRSQTELSETSQTELTGTAHKCSDCDQEFKHRSSLFLHMKHIHGKNSSDMKAPSVMEEKSVVSSSLEGPGKVVRPRKKKCNICGRLFKRECHLASHMVMTHGKSSKKIKGENYFPRAIHKCPQCPREFKRISHFALHKRLHAQKFSVINSSDVLKEEVVATCSVEECSEDKESSCASDTKSEKQAEPKAKCYKCGMKFSHRGHLILHMRRHNNKLFTRMSSRMGSLQEEASKCIRLDRSSLANSILEKIFDNINNKFPKLAGALSHPQEGVFRLGGKSRSGKIDVPADKYKYRCPICAKVFQYAGGIGRHLIVHSNEKPFSCTECGHGCNREDNLRLHMIKCFKSRGKVFEYHKRKLDIDNGQTFLPVRPLNYQECHICGKSFSRINMLLKHMYLHSRREVLTSGYKRMMKCSNFNQDNAHSPVVHDSHLKADIQMKSELRVSLKKLVLGSDKTFQVLKHGNGYKINPEQTKEHKKEREWGQCVRCGIDMEKNFSVKGEPITTECKACEDEKYFRESDDWETENNADGCKTNITCKNFEDSEKPKTHVVDVKELKAFRKTESNIYDLSDRLAEYACIFCSEKFGRKQFLAIHVHMYQHLHSTGESSNCLDCKGPCDVKMHIKNQMKPCVDNLQTKCSVCGKVFNNSESSEHLGQVLEQHMKQHFIEISTASKATEGEENHKNQEDDVPFSSVATKCLQNHINPNDMVALVGKCRINYTCHQCGKVFFRKFGIKEHMTKHDGKQTFLSSESVVDMHPILRAKEMQEECVKCGEKFLKVVYRRRASKNPICAKCKEKMIKSRVDGQLLECNICSRKCAGSKGLKVHLAHHHRLRRQRFTHIKKRKEKFNPVEQVRSKFKVDNLKSFRDGLTTTSTKESSKTELKPDLIGMRESSTCAGSAEVLGKGVHNTFGKISDNTKVSQIAGSDLVLKERPDSTKHQSISCSIKDTPSGVSVPNSGFQMKVTSAADVTRHIVQSTGFGKNGSTPLQADQVSLKMKKSTDVKIMPKTELSQTIKKVGNYQVVKSVNPVPNYPSQGISQVFVQGGPGNMAVGIPLIPSSSMNTVQACANLSLNMTQQTSSGSNYQPIYTNAIQVSPGLIILNAPPSSTSDIYSVLPTDTASATGHLQSSTSSNIMNPQSQNDITSSIGNLQPLSSSPKLVTQQTQNGITTSMGLIMNNAVNNFKTLTDPLSKLKVVRLADNSGSTHSILSPRRRPLKIVVKQIKTKKPAECATGSTPVQNAKPRKLPVSTTTSDTFSLAGNTLPANSVISLKSGKTNPVKMSGDPPQNKKVIKICSSLSSSTVQSDPSPQSNLAPKAVAANDVAKTIPISIKSGVHDSMKALMQVDKVLMYPNVKKYVFSTTMSTGNAKNHLGSDLSLAAASNQCPNITNIAASTLGLNSPVQLNSVPAQPTNVVPIFTQPTSVMPIFVKSTDTCSVNPLPKTKGKGKKADDGTLKVEKRKKADEGSTKVGRKRKVEDSSSEGGRRKKIKDCTPKRRKKKNDDNPPQTQEENKINSSQLASITKQLSLGTDSNPNTKHSAPLSLEPGPENYSAEEEYDKALKELGRPIQFNDNIQIKEEELDLADLSFDDLKLWESSAGIPNDMLLDDLIIKEEILEESDDVP